MSSHKWHSDGPVMTPAQPAERAQASTPARVLSPDENDRGADSGA